MSQTEKIDQALENANLLEKIVKQTIREIEDYDLERLLKKVDAECMDIQHNLSLAKRLAQGVTQKGKKKKKAKRKKLLN